MLSKASTFRIVKFGILGATLYHTIPIFNNPGKEAFENMEGKAENAGDQHFLLFPRCFLLIPRRISVPNLHLFCRVQMLPIWTSLKICRLVKS